MFFSFHQFSVNNTFDIMEFYMVCNTSTTNDFPNVARGLKIKFWHPIYFFEESD